MSEVEEPRSVTVVIPAFRDNGLLAELLDSLRRQKLSSAFLPIEVLVVETEPTEAAKQDCGRFGASYLGIAREDFDHGGTRSWAAQQTSGHLLVFLSQDVLFCDEDTLARLLTPFLQHPSAAACYGRQLAPQEASEAMKIKRSFSYPKQDKRRRVMVGEAVRHEQVLFSNAFGAYRRTDLESIGWFGERQLMCEDVAAVASMLAKGRTVHYVADALVVHRHQESLRKDLARAFDIGASHSFLSQGSGTFPGARGLGFRFLGFGVRQLLNRGIGGWVLIPGFVAGCSVRWVAYSLGRFHRILPRAMIRRMSMHPRWWSG